MIKKSRFNFKGAICGFLSIAMLCSGFSATATDLSEIPIRDKFGHQSSEVTDKDNKTNAAYYFEVINSNNENNYKPYSGEDISVLAKDYSGVSLTPVIETINNSPNPVIVWNDELEWVEWKVDIPENALYQIDMDIYCIDDLGSDTTRELQIDGVVPFREASQIQFRWNWQDSDEIQINNVGDQIAPSQELNKKWVKTSLRDRDGTYQNPFQFYLEKGEHTIRLKYVDKPMAISSLTLKQPDMVKSYKDIESEYQSNNYKYAGEPVKFEAETQVTDRNSNTIKYVANDDPVTYPYKHGYKRLNSIGDNYWSKGGQTIEWSFQVPESGLYKIGCRVLQFYNSGQASYRQIKIDGEVPFKEFEAYKFEYEDDWQGKYLSDGQNNPYYVYLESGKTHTMAMTVVLGEYGLISTELLEAASQLSDLLLKITMITGPNPDPNYEYDLEAQIPNLILDFTNIESLLSKNIEKLNAISGKITPASSSLKQSAAQLVSVIQKPDTIAKRIENLNNCQSNIVTWYTNLKQQPLLLDYFIIDTKDGEINNAQSGFFQKLLATLKNFTISFSKDYDSIGGSAGNEGKTIKVFTTLGNERGEILKLMADKTYTKKTGVSLDLKIVPPGQVNAGQVNALMLSLMSGNAPDVAIGVDTLSPTEFAFRGAAVDLSKMSGFEDMRSNFIPTAFDSVTFRDAVYGIPESMDFRVLMYRTDLAEKMGFKPPDTWEDLYSVTLPILYQNKLTFYMPQEYGIFLYQNGGEYYKEDCLTSALDSANAYTAFQEMINLYTSYGVPYAASFFNRFRSGEIPMGVATFADYLQISVAAPELAGKWAIAPLPGKKQADGSVDRSYTKAIKTTGMIFSQSPKQDDAWEFLKWWMSTETQAEYGIQIESYLGAEGRWNSANIKAYQRTPWNKQDLKIISGMWQHAKEVPPVLGGYFTDRHFNNAWNRIIVQSNSSITPRDSLEMAVEEINKELDKKQREYKHLLEQ
ncbi:MAG: extracellular solute-binding protein [Oscillospiraceae bacterium]